MGRLSLCAGENITRKILVGLLIAIYSTKHADSQTTPFDEYSEVAVPNSVPEAPDDSDKIYTTTLNIVKSREDNSFVSDTFKSAAEDFYAPIFQGFQSVTVTDNTDIDSLVIRVTYDISYAFPILRNAIGGDDAQITATIGSFDYVKQGLERQPVFFSLFSVQDDATQFSFDGSAMCAVVTCTGAYVTCIENTDGINATCVSQCKTGYCQNDAICSHTDANAVPQCACPVLPDLWYLGERCETKIALWLIILLSVIGFLIILLVLIIVCICVIKKRRKKRRKEELANSALPNRSYSNNAFTADDGRATTTAVPQVSLVPRSIPGSTLERDDSFDTVTSSERTRTNHSRHRPHDRRSNATSRSGSTHHSRHHHHHHNSNHHSRHHHGDRHRHHRRHRSRSSERHDTRPPPSPSESSSSSEEETDEKNLSFYEIEVNGLENGDAPSSAAPSTVNTSPIRWLPPRGAETRPGWVPSLGPMMYELPTSNGNLQPNDELPGYDDISHHGGHGDTDI